MPKYVTVGTAPFNELDFWLYRLLDNNTLKAEYPEPFNTYERANAVMEAEQKTDPDNKRCVVPLPPEEVNGKKSSEVMERVANLHAMFVVRPEDGTKVEPLVLVPSMDEVLDDTGAVIVPAFLYKHGRDLIMSPLTCPDLEKHGIGAVGSGRNDAPIRAQSMGHAIQLSSKLSGYNLPFSVIPLPFANVAGMSVKTVARELLVAMEARKAKSRAASAPAASKASRPEVNVAALAPGEAYFRGEAGATITATIKNAAKMEDGGTVYGVCAETGRLYSTVTDGALLWKHIDGGLT